MDKSSPNPAFVSYSVASRTGRVHAGNEDRAGVPDDIAPATLLQKGYLFIVADGMGGHNAGSTASHIAVDVIRQAYYAEPALDVATALDQAISSANATILRQAQQSPGCEGMGATVVAAVVRGNELTVAGVGDSRAYLLHQSRLQQLTVDHTWVAERVAAGILTPEEAAHHDLRHLVTRSLGHKPEVEVDVKSLQMLPGDRLLLCCDGVWEPVGPAELSRQLAHGSPQAAASAIVDHATASGSDDATALVVDMAHDGARGGAMYLNRMPAMSRSQRILVAGVAITVAVVLLGLGYVGVRKNRAAGTTQVAQDTPTAASVQTVLSTKANVPKPTEEANAAPSPTAIPMPTSTPVPTTTPSETHSNGTDFCVLPSAKDLEEPAWPVDSDCKQIVGGLANETRIDVVSTVESKCGRQYVKITVMTPTYWIFPWRIGYLDENKTTCIEIPGNENGHYFDTSHAEGSE